MLYRIVIRLRSKRDRVKTKRKKIGISIEPEQNLINHKSKRNEEQWIGLDDAVVVVVRQSYDSLI